MALFSFSIKGESFHAGRLESKTRKFDLDNNNRHTARSIDHTVSSVAFFSRIDELAELLNRNLYAIAAADDIVIESLRINITGNIVHETTGRKKKSFSNIDISVGIMSGADNKAISGLVAKARARTQAAKPIKNTKLNYSFNSIVHLN